MLCGSMVKWPNWLPGGEGNVKMLCFKCLDFSYDIIRFALFQPRNIVVIDIKNISTIKRIKVYALELTVFVQLLIRLSGQTA